ncbi:hypothetical protein ACFWWC_03585 [Streptomyces sp. NPDC058642]|uniref:hypothetical protein n=1 Tax=Streptomyces sp. NPDC058642 TaxID=3346572 RepID=UPI0036550817
MGPLQWGDVPTALGAVFAGGAAWFAFQTIKSQRQQIGEQREFIGEQLQFMNEQRENLALERAELQATLHDRRSEQARQVIFRVFKSRLSSTTDTEGNAQPSGPTQWGAHVFNESPEPLHDVTVWTGPEEMPTAYRAAAREAGGRFNLPGVRRVSEPLPVPVPVVSAGTVYAFASDPIDDTQLDRPIVHFTDNNGVRWSLDEHGDLQERS